MTPTIRIDDEVYAWLQSQARPFEDTPNSVLRRVSGLGEIGSGRTRSVRGHNTMVTGANRGQKTTQQAFRNPLLVVLKAHQGEIHRVQALKELERAMADQFTDYDRADIKSGTIRWEKSAEWEVRRMRTEGLLKPVQETPRGIWALTGKGWEAAEELVE